MENAIAAVGVAFSSLGLLRGKGAEELVLLFLRLETAVTVLGRSVDELELHLL